MKRLLLGHAIVAATLTFALPTFGSTTVELGPLVASSGNDSDFDGDWDSLGAGCCLAYNGLPDTYNWRSAIEFDLSSIPASATVEDAVFRIRYDGASGTPGLSLQFNQYVGNGSLDLSDFEQIAQISPLLNSFGPGDGTLLYKVPVTEIIQSQLDDGHRYLGFMIQNVAKNQTALLDPSLSVTFIPEPSAMALCTAAAALCLAGARSRNGSKP